MRVGSLVVSRSVLLGAAVVLLSSAVARAATEIGKATRVAPSVTGTTGGRSASLSSGDGVHQNEVIRTAASGNAQLRFIDATNLAVGPSSTVTLDRFVFNPGGTASNFVLDATKGAFRFATGNSNHGAYEIRTPAAVIGVRGTQFFFVVSGTNLRLTVTQGRVIVCPRGLSRASCFEATPGQTIAAQPGRPVVVVSGGGGPPPPREPRPPRPPRYPMPPEPEDLPPDYGPVDAGPPPFGLFPRPPFRYHPRPPRGDGYPPRGDGYPPRGDGYPPRGDGYPPRPGRYPTFGRFPGRPGGFFFRPGRGPGSGGRGPVGRGRGLF